MGNSLAMIGYAFSSKVISLVISRVPDAIAIAIPSGTVNAMVSAGIAGTVVSTAAGDVQVEIIMA